MWLYGDSTALRGHADLRAHWQEAEGSTSWYKALKGKKMRGTPSGSERAAEQDGVRICPQRDIGRVRKETDLHWEMKGEGTKGTR